MPGDSKTDELLDLTRGLKNAVETAQLFGEESFPASFLQAFPSAKVSIQTQNPVSISVVSRPAAAPASVPAPAQRAPASSGLLAEKKRKLDELYAKYAGCTMCPLSAGRTKIVFGVGSVDLKVLFVGEGPGFDEDKQGYPFVGRAGQLLDKIMQSIGLNRNTNAYIANVVKCHPMKDPAQPQMRGNDRPPTPDEVSACREILDAQIEILDPPIICVLGASAARALLNTTEGITGLRGKLRDFQFPVSGKVVPILPTYHPAALLRNELLKKDVWQDMKLLRTLI